MKGIDVYMKKHVRNSIDWWVYFKTHDILEVLFYVFCYVKYRIFLFLNFFCLLFGSIKNRHIYA